MSFILNTKKKAMTEKETKIKIYTIAQGRACFEEVKQLYEKFENYKKEFPYDPVAGFQITKNFIEALANIDIYLVAWLADAEGKIAINNQVVFELEYVPDNIV